MTGLFDPFRLKEVCLRNRIAMSPMCQYSCDNGRPTDWHLVHLGSRAVGGAGLVMVEGSAVSPQGRISVGDSGIWSDDHIEHFARINHFLKQQGAIAGIQLAHAGRKASANRPCQGNDHLEPQEGAWETIAPSPIAFGAKLPVVPRQMTTEDIAQVRGAFVDAAKRAFAAGFELLELLFGHGYLAHEFFSPLTNHRTDGYGGCFDHRIRFLVETFSAVREVWPNRLPLAVRLSVTDWVEGGVTLEESIELVQRLKNAGLDLIDVSHGFITANMSKVPKEPGFMIPLASRIRRETDMATAVGWLITDPHQANKAVREQHTDIVMLAREMLYDPYWPFHAAQKLDKDNPQQLLPVQYAFWLKNYTTAEKASLR